MATDRTDLTHVSTHFQFGENWADFANGLCEANIERARADLARLIPSGRLSGARMLDIGSGSGLSAVAALRSGAKEVVAVDIDPASVATSRRVLAEFAADCQWQAEQASVFDLGPDRFGVFDVVHSWGVLHHTGAMWTAVENAAKLVRPGGVLAIALYAKTPVCGFWRWEKRVYTSAPEWLRTSVRAIFMTAYLASLALQGRNPAAYVREYVRKRGMNWSHDVHDWLGGYPYESATPAEVGHFLGQRGLRLVASHTRAAPALGLFGSPCNEFLFERDATQGTDGVQTHSGAL